MSDNFLPLAEQVRLDVFRRDGVDFAPILAPLQRVAASARQYAGLLAADGIIGSSGLRLRSQLEDRWDAFIAAVVNAGLVSADLTPNALLLTCNGEPPLVEKFRTVVYELWDLISHHRRGRFSDAAGLDLLANQVDVTAQLLGGLTPRAQTLATPTSPPLTENEPITLAAGGFTLRGEYHALTGRPYQMLRALLQAHDRRLTANHLRKSMGIDDLAVDQPEQVVRDTAGKLRKALRKAAGSAQKENPLPCIGRGEFLAYALKLDSHPNLPK